MNVLVTGGAAGLGEAVTRRLGKNPSNSIWFSYHSSVADAKAIEESLPNVHAIHCDFREAGDLARLLEKMDEMNLDGLINNALPVRITKMHFHKMDLETFRAGFNQGIMPTISITQKAIGIFRKKKAGRIVTVLTSALVGKPPAGYSEYAAAKAYLHLLTKSWASENASFGITSNCVSPGYMATRLTNDTDERMVEEMVARHPLKRLLQTGEVAEAVEFYLMCSAQVNGNNLVINAGAEMS